jgi:ABC-2 type transport system permease protein
VAGWGAGLFLTGLSYGSLGTEVGDLLGDSSMSKDMFLPSGMDLVDGFYATSILMLALMSSGFAITSAQRPRHDETGGRLEALLSTGLSRTRWLLAQVLLTSVAAIVVVLLGGLGLGVGYALAADDGGAIGRYLAATLPHAAPVLVLSGLATLAYGARSRWTPVAWLGLLLAVVVLLFGTVFRMPEWLQDLSPFHHLALVPAEDFRWPPLLVLAALALALPATGIVLFTRRDVEVR